jgi:hypothetical protein
MQAKFLGRDDCNLKLKLPIIDEFSMLKARELCYVDKRLSQIMECKDPFGGITAVLVGDVAQLPPVQGNPVWNFTTSNGGNDLTGKNICKHFSSVAILRENHRVDHNNKDSVLFEGFLTRLRRGDSTEDDLLLVRQKCSRYAMESQSPGSWEWGGLVVPMQLICMVPTMKSNQEMLSVWLL